MTAQHERTMRALNVLTKWRTLFAGWQLGTRPKGDPECDAVRDHRELTILLRAVVWEDLSAVHGHVGATRFVFLGYDGKPLGEAPEPPERLPGGRPAPRTCCSSATRWRAE